MDREEIRENDFLEKVQEYPPSKRMVRK